MEAARTAIHPCIVGPDFLSCPLVQCVQLAGTRSNKKKIATDRGRGKNSTAGLDLPQDIPFGEICLPNCKTGHRRQGSDAQDLHFFAFPSSTSNCTTASIAASALLPGRLWLLQKIENTKRLPDFVCP